MAKLMGQKVLLGITGGIAAYKTPELVRQLISEGAQVQVVLSRQAVQFVAPLALQGVLGAPVFLADDEGPSGMRHIELAKWADRILIAPATANRLAMMAHGRAEDLLGNCLLATKAQVIVCPAMNRQMYQAASTQENCETLRRRGIHLWGPAWGEQACGDVGPGRMMNPEQIVQCLIGDQRLAGHHVVLTAGPTREPIDPVRFISNRSSGKMGYALAEAFRDAGAKVTLISGPVKLTSPPMLNVIRVETAQQMLEAVLEQVAQADIFVGVAAVADYAPAQLATEKIKKSADTMTLNLKRNPDILASVASHPHRPLCIGFAAETHNGLAFARDKLTRKKLDMIALNEVHQPDIGFDSDKNALTLITETQTKILTAKSKQAIAEEMVDFIIEKVISKQRAVEPAL